MSSQTAATIPERHYRLECLGSGSIIDDCFDPVAGNMPLANPASSKIAFLRTRYDKKRFEPGDIAEGIYRFSDWLPVHRRLSGSSAPVTYRSEGLASELGLPNLFITFSGYWPERGVRMLTGTFKECEAYSVYGRMPSSTDAHLVVASAGNTARAFLRVASDNNLPLVVVVPEANLRSIWTVGERGKSTIVIAAGSGADYSDAIHLSNIVTEIPGYVPEGGAKNVARRDGMATTMLSAAEVIGRIPDHYVQAVGSGTGAVSAWEANLRLIEDGRFGSHRARLHLAQNAPFTLLVDSWNRRERSLAETPEEEAKVQIDKISAKVLANRHPPYSPIGGVFDALTGTNGEMYGVTNDTALRMAALFDRTEGIDITPAAAIACGALEAAVGAGEIKPNETVMLNITGGGVSLVHQELDIRPVTPDIVATSDMWNTDSLQKALKSLSGR